MQTELERQDDAARKRALDVSGSFVVQAPAGSGKTGLLTQRLLALLAQADVPEEVLAITFTRKAAGEMRQRVIVALRDAELGRVPEKPYEKITHELARRALARSLEQDWHLERHPARLHIQTIDALAQMLARSLPILSRAGSGLDVAKDATALYDEASLRLLAELESGAGPERELAVLLEHFDNNFRAVRELLAAMLMRRDQWLTQVLSAGAGPEWRASLEHTLAAVLDDALGRLTRLIPPELNDALWQSSIRAAGRCENPDEDFKQLARVPGAAAPQSAQVALWQTVARFLLTADADAPGDWRKPRGLDKRIGFPTTHRDDKQRHGEIIQQLSGLDGMLAAWQAVVRLPAATYDARQWRVLDALLVVLERLATHLRVIFAERGKVDYVEVAVAARDALGPGDDPTDLALRLDYRIRHILVDEFQDTSHGQIELLSRLTAGWTGTDGRTLFCVGDPMQSIYRFRQADVALFLRVRRHGIGNLQPATLTLTRNFRSQAGIVDWVNRAFAGALPAEDDLARGAVRYAPVEPTRERTLEPAVRAWPAFGLDAAAEAQRVIEIIRGTERRSPESTVAVLGRTRKHVREIATALRSAGLRFQAVELETLGERQAVRDLTALTRALCHRDDRVAWFAVLRAPYCGLTLLDLAVLGARVRERTVWDLLRDEQTLAHLTSDGRERLARVTPILAAALTQFGRRGLAVVVEGTWLALGGPASVEELADLDNAGVFFDRLARVELAGDLDDPADLERLLADLHAAPDAAASERLQVMTIHKAKGLEWDVVILPGLGRRPRRDDPRLLYSVELELASGESGLILAPARASAEESDPLESYVKGLERERTELESARLLYVAATRAREELHVLGHVDAAASDTQGERKAPQPARSSLLEILWPVVRQDFENAASAARAAAVTAPTQSRSKSSLRRFALNWEAPPMADRPFQTQKTLREEDVELRPEFDWVTEVARFVGVIVHRDLERRVRVRIASGRTPDVDRSTYEAELRELGVPTDRLSAAASRVAAAVAGVLEDERGRWILAPHAGESSEWTLTADIDGQGRQLIIDRSFIDEQGTRWVIDYKTSSHAGGALEEFLAREEERYRTQLARYASVVRLLGPEPVRSALYFPLLGAWREIV